MATIIREEFQKMKAWTQTLTLLTGADDNKIVTSVDMKNTTTYTIAAQPSAPSLIGFGVTATSTADTMGTIAVVGTDFYDAVQSETVTPVAGSTVWTTKYYKTITSLIGTGWAAVDGADKIIVGVPMSAGIYAPGRNVTVASVSGNIWVNPNAVATEANGFPLTTGQSLSLVVPASSGVLSVIADSSGATFKAIVWGE